MELSQMASLATSIFGGGAGPATPIPRVVDGVADSSSSSGLVSVMIDGGSPIQCKTIGKVAEGDRVLVIVQDGEPLVIGSPGWGDSLQTGGGEGGGGITEETDPTVPSWAKQPNKPSYTASEVGAAEEDHEHPGYAKTASLAKVATSGSYNDLTNKPTIPNTYTHPSYSAQSPTVQEDATPGFGDEVALAFPFSDAQGHITKVEGRSFKIPNAIATTSAAGLMSATDKSTLAIAASNASTALSTANSAATAAENAGISANAVGARVDGVEGDIDAISQTMVNVGIDDFENEASTIKGWVNSRLGNYLPVNGKAASAAVADSCTGNAATASVAASCTGNAATATFATSATKATQDAQGHTIHTYYATKDQVNNLLSKDDASAFAKVAQSNTFTQAQTINASLTLSGDFTAGGNFVLKPPSGEGGQILLEAAADDSRNNGIALDTANGDFRIFGLESRDGTSRPGYGSVFGIDPYDMTIYGGYSFDGTAAKANADGNGNNIAATYSPKPTVLYSNSAGTTGTVVLSESAANFSYIVITVGYSDVGACQSLTVYGPNGKTVDISAVMVTNSGGNLQRQRYTISGTTISNYVESSGKTATYRSDFSPSGHSFSQSSLYVKSVLGFK